MPPGPAYNWLCVVCSAADILSRAAHIRATQLAHRSSPLTAKKQNESPERRLQKSPLRHLNADTPILQGTSISERPLETSERLEIQLQEVLLFGTPSIGAQLTQILVSVHVYRRAANVLTARQKSTIIQGTLITHRETISLWRCGDFLFAASYHYGLMKSKIGLAASLGYGAASEIIRRTGSQSDAQPPSVMMTEANVTRLVSKLSQMRGAALKLGQFFSIQGKERAVEAIVKLTHFSDTHALPTEIDKIFRRVQDSAHYMPDWQMEVSNFFLACNPIPHPFSESYEDLPRSRLGIKLLNF